MGSDFNSSLMQGISERGAGFYAYLDDAGRLNDVLEKELGQARASIARQVRFELDVPAGATVTDVPGRQFVRSGSKVSITLPDFAPGQTAQVFVALQVANDASMAKISSTLTWRDVARAEQVQTRAELVAAVTASQTDSDASRDEQVFAEGLRAVGSRQLVLAAAAYESGNTEQAFALMGNVRQLFGMSADALAGDSKDLDATEIAWRNTRDPSARRPRGAST